MYHPLFRSSISRGAPFEQVATMFTGATNVYFNVIKHALKTAEREKTPQAYRRAATAIVTAGILAPLGNTFVDWLRDKARGKDSNLVAGYINSLASYVYFVRELERSAVSKIQRGNFAGYSVEIPVLRVANLMTDIFGDIGGMLTGKTVSKRKSHAQRAALNTIEVIASLYGIPFTPLKSWIKKPTKKKKNDLFNYSFTGGR